MRRLPKPVKAVVVLGTMAAIPAVPVVLIAARMRLPFPCWPAWGWSSARSGS